MRCKVRYVFSPLAERGNVQWKNAQPVIEIFAETPCSYIRNKVAVGCCDDTHTGANQQRIRISGAKLPIPRELLAGYPQLAPDPSVGVHKSPYPQNSKSLSTKSNSSKRGLTIRGTFTPSAGLRARVRNPGSPASESDNAAFAERRVSG